MKQTLIDTQGAVGYLDYGRVRGEDENLGLAIIENASGTFVSPSADSIQAGVAAAEIAGDEIVWRESNNPRA